MAPGTAPTARPSPRPWRDQIEAARALCISYRHGDAATARLAKALALLIDSTYSSDAAAVLDRLPANALTRHAGIAFAAGRRALFAADRERARRWYASAMAAAPDPPLHARLAWELGCVALMEGQVRTAQAAYDEGRAAAGRDAPDLFHLRALIAEQRGRRSAAIRDFRRAAALGNAAHSLATRVIALRNLAALLEHAEPRAATGLCALALALIDGQALDERLRPSVENVLAYALLCAGDIDGGLGHARSAASDATRVGHPLVAAYARFNTALARELLGDLDGARRALDDVAAAAERHGFAELRGWTRIRAAWLMIRTDRLAVAEEMLDRDRTELEGAVFARSLAMLRAVIAGERDHSASVALGRIAKASLEDGDALTAFVARLWIMRTHALASRRTTAQRALAAVIRIGEPRGFHVSPNWWSEALVETARAIARPAQQPYVDMLVRRARPADGASTVTFSTGGTIRVRGEAIPDERWRVGRSGSRVLRRLVGALASAHPVGIERHELADLLWPESDGDRAIRNLDAALNDLRRLLGRVGDADVRREGSRYRLEGGSTV